jgi:hypothetical protein
MFLNNTKEIKWYRDAIKWIQCQYNRCTPYRYTSDAGDVICFTSLNGISSREITVVPFDRASCEDDRIITGKDLKNARQIIESITVEVEP